MRPRPSIASPAPGPWAVGLVLLAACTGAGPETGPPLRIADLVPVAERGVRTGLVLPPAGEWLLGEGWEQATPGPVGPRGLWVEGRRATFRFHVAEPGEAVLEARVLSLAPPGEDPFVEVDVGRSFALRAPLPRDWETVELPLPAHLVRVGWNEVTLRFGHAVRPIDLDPGLADTRRLSARFREIRVRGAAPVDPRSAVEVTAGGAIRMPAGSTLDVVLRPEAGDVLSGSLVGEGAVTASVERVEPGSRVLVEATPGAEPTAFAVEPGPGWVRVRLRVRGASGFVEWREVALSTTADPTVAGVGPHGLIEAPRSGRLARPDVILVVLDTSRADAFDGSLETHRVEALAADGVRFTEARSPSPWTAQSMPPLLTGRHAGALACESWQSPVPPDVPMIQERMATAGYLTVLYSQHELYRINASLRKGFERHLEAPGEDLERREHLPTRDELFASGRPTFALVHLMPPHNPYDPPAPFRGSRTGWYEGDFPVDMPALNRASRPRGRKPTAEDVRWVRGRYDENVLYADHLVGRLVDTLREAGRYEDSLVIVTSDHGEAFFEHGRFGHTRNLYDEMVRVPLVIKLPGAVSGYRGVVETPVGLVDLVPTLVDGLGLGEGPAYQGRSLLPLVFGEAVPERSVYAETRGVNRLDAPARPSSTWIEDGWKLVVDGLTGDEELYDLVRDPGERVDRAEGEALRLRGLRQGLALQHLRNAALAGSRSEAPDRLLAADEEDALRALGYLPGN